MAKIKKMGWLLWSMIGVVLLGIFFQTTCGISYYSANNLAFSGVFMSIDPNNETADIVFNDVFFKNRMFGVWVKPKNILVQYRPDLNGVTVLTVRTSLWNIIIRPEFGVWHASKVLVQVPDQEDVTEWRSYIQETKQALAQVKSVKTKIKPKRVVPRTQHKKNKAIIPTQGFSKTGSPVLLFIPALLPILKKLP